MRRRLLVVLAALIAALFGFAPSQVFAHPLGNFTVNRYAGLRVQPNGIDVDYVVDMAEIPAYQEISQSIGLDSTGAPDQTQADVYRARKCAEILPNLSLTLNGKPLSLTMTSTAIEFPPGSGGLLTLRLTCEYHANLVENATNTVVFHDSNFLDRIGWRELVVQGDGTVIRDSDVPNASVSARLTNYPSAQIKPLNQIEADFAFDSSTSANVVSSSPSTNSNVAIVQQTLRALVPSPYTTTPATTPDSFAALITASDLSAPAILLSLLLAIGLGALHAVSPGHGKTIMAAYLVGTRGSFGQAVLLGLTVTVTHTIGVLTLGLLTLFASRYIVPESLYPWLSLGSGLLVVGMGMALFVSRWRERIHTHSHDHDHSHEHRHDIWGHAHSHLPDHATGRLTWKSLVGLGLAGGLVPSTSALILLLAAISLRRIPFGIVLIVAFGIGMALVLVGIGVLLVRASHWMERHSTTASWMESLPWLSAIVVTIVGILVMVEAAIQMGWINL